MRVTMYGLLHPYLGADCCARLSVCRLIMQRAGGLADSATAPSLLAISYPYRQHPTQSASLAREI